MKRLALFLDGTWNTVKSKTNVWLLSRQIADSDGTIKQECFYQAGVGTKWYDGLRGGALGYGLSKHVLEAYEWILANYEDGDQIFIFGFSRGAFTARSLAGLIARCGLLHREAGIDPKELDVAIARLEPAVHLTTGETFSNKMLALTTDRFELGDTAHQYSYPDPIIFDQPEGPQLMVIPLLTEGKVIDWFPQGMGSLFPSPCYVIEGYIGAGSSGGPVMDKTGRVFAISSRGCVGGDYYYAVPVRAIADIRVTSVKLSTPPVIEGPTIKDMVSRGLISFVQRVNEPE
tara:strand:- start:215 stop:1078 length:864 start_codon:yes stop_codon:yes gene_type:complete